MRILLVSPYFPPQPAVASLRVHSFASTWSRAGEDVTVLTTRKREDQAGWPLPTGDFRVVEVPYRGPRILEAARRVAKREVAPAAAAAAEGSGRNGGLLRPLRRLRDRRGFLSSVRMPDLTDAWVRPAAAWAVAEPAWDVVVSSAGPYTAHLAALEIVRAHRATRWVAEFRDLWVDNHLYPGLFPFTLRERTLERRCLRRADLLVTVSDALAEILARKSSAPTAVVYNGFDPAELAAVPPEPAFPADGVRRLVFTGTLYPTGQDPAPLLRGLAVLRERDPEAVGRLRLVTAGPAAAQWRAAAERHGVADALEDRGPVARAEARRLQRDADALVLVDFESAVEGALGTKLFEYLSVSAPVLVIGGPAASPIKSVVRDTGRGLPLGHDTAAITETLERLVRGRLETPPAGDPALLATFTREHQATLLLERMRTLGSGSRR